MSETLIILFIVKELNIIQYNIMKIIVFKNLRSFFLVWYI